jgi:hypothetical protein
MTIIQNVGAINIFWLIVNPNHFGQSVENLFMLSCLFDDGKCGFHISDHGEPMVGVSIPECCDVFAHSLQMFMCSLQNKDWKISQARGKWCWSSIWRRGWYVNL